MLRVLRITPHFYRPGRWPVAFDPVGGMQNQTWTIAQGLDAGGGVEQTVLTTFIPGSPRHVRLSPTLDVRCVGFRLPEFVAGPLLCFTWFLAALPMLFRARRHFDLVHIHFNHSVWCRVMTLLLARLGMPVVVSMNTALWAGLQHALRLKGKPYDLTAWIERKALKSANWVVALTERYRLEADAGAGLGGRVSVIADAVDAEAFRRPVPAVDLHAFRGEHAIPEDRAIVSFIGRISPEKGWQDLPYFVERLSAKGVFVLICGDGPDRPKLEAALAATARPGSWTITGFVSPAEVKKALRISRVMVLPSRREVLGSVLLEAMAAGVPAVAYAVGGVGDVAGAPAAFALVEQGRRDDFIGRTLELLDDGPVREAFLQHARRRVQDFSLEPAVSLTVKLYKSVLAEVGSGSRGPTELLAFQKDGGSPGGA
jgi:glycosyltransferase involved in cell wall biosynthesis